MTMTVLAEIASGGMGSVEMARVESGPMAGQVLAIKRLHPNIANDQTFVNMFLDEAWLTAAMKSPHVMGVVAHGTDERGMFLAVELIEGVPLSRLLKEARVKKETFSEQAVACIGMQICDGLTEAHTLKGTDGKPLGLVHRDLTPGNVLVAFDGTVKIVDFGIAKAEERITHTRTGTMKGKPAYMAPEQAKGGKNMDLRADLFSFGVMIFELLAARRPWVEKSAFDVIMSAALKPHPNLAELRPGVSPVFVEIIDKCLAKKPAERWNSAAEIRDKLVAWRKAQTFAKPDLEVLREFVQRNSQAQIEWFQRARKGEFAKGSSQTFKELEEAIDEARKRSGEAPYSIPPASSGRAAFEAMTPSRAKLLGIEEGAPSQSSPRILTPVPMTPPPATPAGMTPPPISAAAMMTPPPAGSSRPPAPGADSGDPHRVPGTMQSLTEASRIAQSMGPPKSQAPMSSPATVPLPPTEPIPQPPPQRVGLGGTIALTDEDLAELNASGARKGLGLGGTEYMEVSPLKGMKVPEPRIENAAEESDLSATIRVPELSDRPIRDLDGSSRSVVRPAGALVEDDDLALGATLRSDDANAAREMLAKAGLNDPVPAAGAQKQDATRTTNRDLSRLAATRTPDQAPKGLSGTTVMLLVLVAFVAGGAIAAWVAKTYLLKPSGAIERENAAQAFSG
jgi:serine/threonine protein kinase